MPDYTIELWRIRSQVEAALQDYPIFDDDYREVLNKNLLDFYHNREIGFETVERFIFAMRRKMNLLMPQYNKLYESTRLQFDPLSTVDLTTISEAIGKTVSEASSQATTDSMNHSESRAVQSTTPQVMLGGNKDYATGAADSFSDGNGAGSTTENTDATNDSESNSETTVKGYQGSAADLLIRYRDTLINVDALLINDWSDMFMRVYNLSDNFTPYYTRPLPNL
jgi:hypothetical protein